MLVSVTECVPSTFSKPRKRWSFWSSWQTTWWRKATPTCRSWSAGSARWTAGTETSPFAWPNTRRAWRGAWASALRWVIRQLLTFHREGLEMVSGTEKMFPPAGQQGPGAGHHACEFDRRPWGQTPRSKPRGRWGEEKVCQEERVSSVLYFKSSVHSQIIRWFLVSWPFSDPLPVLPWTDSVPAPWKGFIAFKISRILPHHSYEFLSILEIEIKDKWFMF